MKEDHTHIFFYIFIEWHINLAVFYALCTVLEHFFLCLKVKMKHYRPEAINTAFDECCSAQGSNAIVIFEGGTCGGVMLVM